MDKEQLAIQRIRDAAAMAERAHLGKLYVTDSGGKDSSVLVHLAIKSGVPVEIVNHHTTADAPQTVYFIRDKFKRLEEQGIECNITLPTYKGQRTSMWQLIPIKKMPPTRVVRYCCAVLKEQGGKGRFVATGVRWDESVNRRNNRGILEIIKRERTESLILNNDNDEKRREFETCTMKGKRIVNPIVDWTTAEVWDYIHAEHIPYNPLYECGYKRVGCIGCPLAKKARLKEFADFPVYEKLYISAFDRMLDVIRAEKGDAYMASTKWGERGIDVFHWWMDDGVLPGQMTFDEMIGEAE